MNNVDWELLIEQAQQVRMLRDLAAVAVEAMTAGDPARFQACAHIRAQTLSTLESIRGYTRLSADFLCVEVPR